jgi:hypothetical protein
MSFRDANAATVRSQSTASNPVEVRALRPAPQALFGVSPKEMPEVTPRVTRHSRPLVIRRWGSRYLSAGSNSEPLHSQPVVVR